MARYILPLRFSVLRSGEVDYSFLFFSRAKSTLCMFLFRFDLFSVSGDIVSGDRISDYTDYLFGVPYMVQRELEKNMIREEIMAEMARRQALEDEVWREIRMKKELSAVPMVYHHQRRPYDGVVNGGFTARVVDELPFQRHPAAAMAEFDSPPQTAKGRLLLLVCKDSSSSSSSSLRKVLVFDSNGV
ncbi:hypothetical protein U1Q18_027086 [Sarracenia purpurea var. burkii]